MFEDYNDTEAFSRRDYVSICDAHLLATNTLPSPPLQVTGRRFSAYYECLPSQKPKCESFTLRSPWGNRALTLHLNSRVTFSFIENHMTRHILSSYVSPTRTYSSPCKNPGGTVAGCSAED